ncbi:MAG: hypothetical protein LIO79_10305 [Rikenellaceae bacterium]|nr:hypothetical protein [Rikenellaceae bacterium]
MKEKLRTDKYWKKRKITYPDHDPFVNYETGWEESETYYEDDIIEVRSIK